MQSLEVVAGGGGAPVLPSLGSLESLKEPGPQGGPGRPEQGEGSAKLPIYIGVFRAFRSFRQKSKFRFGQHAI